MTAPRTTWPHRGAGAAVFLTGMTMVVVWMVLPLLAADLAVAQRTPPLLAYTAAGALALAPLLEVANLVLHARTALPAVGTLRHLRAGGGTWWEAGTFAAYETDPMAAGRLVHTALAFADTTASASSPCPRTR
ncbi:hypothetical protein [Streptomyces wuyuanensis]|uniref:hypothetical protein n=1 Tax=Streptomyces wuyuanensis TaxID=1196353 RepID=UPI00343B51F5